MYTHTHTHTHTHTQTHTRVGAEIRKALDTVDLIFFYEISSSPHERFRTAYLEVSFRTAYLEVSICAHA